MPSLSDHIDRLAANTKNISAIVHSASISSSRPGPFTSAILHAHLGELIRDVDPSELGLFSLVHPERAAVQDKPTEIERVNFHGATPLRRPHPRRDDASRARDPDPELYAQAAMKYMDRYKLVRPMPRAQARAQAILERISVVKQSIDDLNDRLHRLEQTRSSTEPDYRAQLEEEECRIRDLRSRLSELTDKRLALLKAKKSHLDLAENKGVARKPIASSKPNPEEDKFWNTPAASARTFKFTGDNLLMDEKVDFGDISAISFSASPVISKTVSNIFTSTVLDPPLENPRRRLFQAPDTLPDIDASPEHSYHNLSDSPPPPTQGTGDHDTPEPIVEVDVPALAPEGSPNDGISGILVTHKVESIANKIWTVMADLVTAAATARGINLRDKPSARDLIRYLQHMQEATPSNDLAPVTINNTPTLQQVLIATLTIGLLASTPDHSLPLTNVKELLANRTENFANPSQLNSSRIVYHCVAKRMLKIDRSGSEQIVRFDV